MLNIREHVMDIARQLASQQQADEAVQFVHRADCLDAAVGFFHARSNPEAGGAVIAGAGVNLGKTMSHIPVFSQQLTDSGMSIPLWPDVVLAASSVPRRFNEFNAESAEMASPELCGIRPTSR